MRPTRFFGPPDATRGQRSGFLALAARLTGPSTLCPPSRETFALPPPSSPASLTRGEAFDGGESICPHAAMGAQWRVIGLRVGSPAIGLARRADRRPLQPPWLKEQT